MSDIGIILSPNNRFLPTNMQGLLAFCNQNQTGAIFDVLADKQETIFPPILTLHNRK